jgi:hypothetical protein
MILKDGTFRRIETDMDRNKIPFTPSGFFGEIKGD